LFSRYARSLTLQCDRHRVRVALQVHGGAIASEGLANIAERLGIVFSNNNEDGRESNGSEIRLLDLLRSQEQTALKHPGDYIINFKHLIARVFVKGENFVTSARCYNLVG
jgi:hypothetical protein